VDLEQKPMARGESERFIERFGLAGLVDTGLKYFKLFDSELLGWIEPGPTLLCLPLIRGPAH